jgi:transcriptional regulator with GAF, ATPase, and Fis domain
MQMVFERVRAISRTDSNVLILGESGTGKDLVARAIHFSGPRKDAPFVKVNCAAIPEALLESELFGYRRGAFTGASGNRKGRFESAEGGTVFLDEISDMAPPLQAKLLQVLEEKSFYPLGGDRAVSVDVQIISATNKNLGEKVKDGTFREDLYYRLNALSINLPPLRERQEDIPLLIDYFLKGRGKSLRFAPEAMASLIEYNWPGNVRELENVVEMASVTSGKNVIKAQDLPEAIAGGAARRDGAGRGTPALAEIDLPEDGIDYNEELHRYGRELLIAALKRSGWSRTGAARILGLTRDQMKYYFKKYGLETAEEIREEIP